MIDPDIVLAGIRRDLREIVLPAVEEEFARTAVIAMVGILGELDGRVRSDQRWCAESVNELAAGCERWAAALGGGEPAAQRVLELRARAALEPPAAARETLLAAACETLGACDEHTVRDVRRVLAADLSRQLARPAGQAT